MTEEKQKEFMELLSKYHNNGKYWTPYSTINKAHYDNEKVELENKMKIWIEAYAQERVEGERQRIAERDITKMPTLKGYLIEDCILKNCSLIDCKGCMLNDKDEYVYQYDSDIVSLVEEYLKSKHKQSELDRFINTDTYDIEEDLD